VFLSTVNVNEESIQGASKLLQGEIKATPATLELAKLYLNDAHNPRHLPVPLHYNDLSLALFDPKGWLNRKLAQLGEQLG
jgi:hypothetical protein